ncbi:hypothetical protein DAPPUDRAFT_308740 [Daphnia pulex]|uniref:Uncharacterized protein n=1 Tax=Daphnia pulex TaxID=6669 RepID=E9H953_DAPPU|nr:hypothetical protein DAPPUDRAFT_308740 [Daphnia pulex]|eukprot:EFX71729.1 hypothetical protein DAPPUDRAFT_308740 [Daphnia pulex]
MYMGTWHFQCFDLSICIPFAAGAFRVPVYVFFSKFFSYTATTSASCMSVYSAKFKSNERQNHDAEHLGCNVKNIKRSPIIIIIKKN